MIRRLSTWFVVALAATALAAGCGSSSKSSTTTTTTSTPAAGNAGAAATSATTATGGAAATGTAPGGAGASVTKVNGPVAVANCKRAVHAQSVIPAEQKARLEAICAKAAGGSEAALQKVAVEVCLALARSAPLRPGVSRERALAVCKPR
jgi:hypothetical protein